MPAPSSGTETEHTTSVNNNNKQPASCHVKFDWCPLRSRKLFGRLLVIRYALLRLIKLQMRNFLLKHQTNPHTKPTSRSTSPQSTNEPAPAAPAESALTSLLKLFLIICYFVATLCSLLLLVQLYFTTRHEGLQAQLQNPTQAKSSSRLSGWSGLESKSVHFRDGEQLILARPRNKRSLEEDYSLVADASGGEWNSERVPEEKQEMSGRQLQVPLKSFAGDKANYSRQIFPEPSKVADSTNAFHLHPTTASDNDWIPIVNSRSLAQPQPPQVTASNLIRQAASLPSFPERPKIQAEHQDTLASESRFSSQQYLDSHARRSPFRGQNRHHHSHHHHHMTTPTHLNHNRHQHQHYNQQPRMPRFNLFRNQPAKLYRRVLVCEKSLVSLEYVRHQPNLDQLQYDSEFNFDDNSIDFDSSLTDPLYGAASSANSVDESYRRSSAMMSANLSSDLLLAETRTVPRTQPAPLNRRDLYLTDEDPLVGCDMWDLEKGLKNRKPPHFILRMAVRTDFDTLRDAINRCRQLSEKNVPMDEDSSYPDGFETVSAEDLVSLMSVKRGLIPGTKWCGLGDQATSYNDLGSKHRIDICCRAHDHCPIRLKPFRNDYGVLNIALYTKSHCDCDADFYHCLRDARSKTADMLGNLYFNVMKLQCIREERLKVCREMRPIALGFERCVRYEDSPGAPPPARQPNKLEAPARRQTGPPAPAPASGLLVVAGVGAGQAPPPASSAGKSYLRSQYELRQLRQLELMSKMKQRQQLPEAPGPGEESARQPSGARQHHHYHYQQQHQHQQQQLKQQDLVARSHELSKQRFFERLERRKSMSISDGAADATCCRITNQTGTSLNQMSAAASAQQQVAGACNRQRHLDEPQGHQQAPPDRQPMPGVYQSIVCRQQHQHQQQQQKGLNESSQAVDECQSYGSSEATSCRPDNSEDVSIAARSNKQQVAGASSAPASAQLIAFYSSSGANSQAPAGDQPLLLVGFSPTPPDRLSPSHEQVYQLMAGDQPVTKVSAAAAESHHQSNEPSAGGSVFADATPRVDAAATTDQCQLLLLDLEPDEESGGAGSRLEEIYNNNNLCSSAGDNKVMRPLNQQTLQSSSTPARSTNTQQQAAGYLLAQPGPADTMEAEAATLEGAHLSAPAPGQHERAAPVSRAISSENHDGQPIKEPPRETTGGPARRQPPAPETVIGPAAAGPVARSADGAALWDTLVQQPEPHRLPVDTESASQAQQVHLQTTITNAASNGINPPAGSGVITEAGSPSPPNEGQPPLGAVEQHRPPVHDQGPYADSGEQQPPDERPQDNEAHHESAGSSRANDSASCENIVLLEEEFGEPLIESFGVGASAGAAAKRQSPTGSSLADDDEATSSCGSSGFGASASVTSSGSTGSAKLSLAALKRSAEAPAHYGSSARHIMDDTAPTGERPQQVLDDDDELYSGRARQVFRDDDHDLFGYKRLVGPDQSYPGAPLAHTCQLHLVDNHSYATVSAVDSHKHRSDRSPPASPANIYVNLPGAPEYAEPGSRQSAATANKMQPLAAGDKLADTHNSRTLSASPSLQSYQSSSSARSSASAGFSALAPVAASANAQVSGHLASPDSLANSRKNKSSLLKRFGCLVSRAFAAGGSPGHDHQWPAQVKSGPAPDEPAEDNKPAEPQTSAANETHHYQQSAADASCAFEPARVKQQDLVILPTKHVNQADLAHTICRHDDRLSRGQKAHSSQRQSSGGGGGDSGAAPARQSAADCCPKLLNTHASSLDCSSADAQAKKSGGSNELSRIANEDYGYLKKGAAGCRCCGRARNSSNQGHQLRGCIEIDCVRPAEAVLQSDRAASKQHRSLLRLFSVTSSLASESTPNLASAAHGHAKARSRKPPGNHQKTSRFWGFSSLMLAAGNGADPANRRKQKSANESLDTGKLQLSGAATQHHSLALHGYTKRRPHHHHHHRAYHHHHRHHHERRASPTTEATNGHFRSLQLTSTVRHSHRHRSTTKRSSAGYCSGGECSPDAAAAGFAASVAGQLIKISKSDGSQLIELRRTPGKPWGFFVARGSINSTKGIFISRMHDEATSSALAGLLAIGDRILAIDECQIEPDCDILRVNQLISKKSKILLKVKPFKG